MKNADDEVLLKKKKKGFRKEISIKENNVERPRTKTIDKIE